MREVVVVSAVRTAIGTYGGALKNMPLAQLASQVTAEALKRSQLPAEQIGHVVFGNVVASEPADAYLARRAALEAGLNQTTPALTVNRLCGSGLEAIISGAQQLQLGHCDSVVAGGAESLSRVPYNLPSARFGQRLGNGQMIDVVSEVLNCPFNHYHMGVTAENLAERYNISREQQDELALEGQRRALAAIESGRFDDQIVPVTPPRAKAPFARDEHPRADASAEQLAKLKPVFKADGTVTAGNASGLNDAAAALVMTTAEMAEQSGCEVLAKLVDYSVVGVDPSQMGIGPVPAIESILQRQNLTVEQIDLFEINEAFAAQALAVAQQLQLPQQKLNPNGSGIALGHPLGATGAILAVKALHELKRINGRYAIVALCIGGGQGIAALFER